MRGNVKHAWKILLEFLFVLTIVSGSIATVWADVNPGDVVDQSNWQKVQGVVPDSVMDYIKKGWITVKVGKLNYEPADIISNEAKESLKSNSGKYGINARGEVYEKATGTANPYDIIGVPFPELDLKDPQVGLMMLKNHVFSTWWRGNTDMTASLHFVGSKLERTISGPQRGITFLGTSQTIAQQALVGNQFGEKIEGLFVMKLTDPFELNGLATMTYQYADNKPDKVFAYVPALRRVRTMTAASRSDAMFGTDYALDDASGGFMGQPKDFTCTYLRSQDTLARYAISDLVEAFKTAEGTYEMKKNYPNIKWGFETPGWKGKPWATTNDIWVKRHVHVIECKAKDPYYNYGKFELWYDPKSCQFAYKIIYDRTGKRWKVMSSSSIAYRAKDGRLGKVDPAYGDWIYDEQRDHATCIDEFNIREKKTFFAKLSPKEFTMGGLVKFSK